MAKNDWNDINDPGLPFFIRERMRKEREAEKQREKDVIDWDDAVDKPVGSLKVDFLRWRHTDEKKFRETYDVCSHGDIIELKAEAQGIHKGERIRFEVEEFPADKNETFGKQLWSKSATADTDNTAVVKYTVDLSRVKDPSKLRFTASVRSKYADTKCPIKISDGGITDSVGLNGKNIPGDVIKVKKKLKELGYPVKDESEIISPEDIKAIRFFQALNKEIPHGLVTIDGKIDKGGKTEAALFGKDGKKYEPPNKGEVKSLEVAVEKKKDDAINGTDTDLKDKWQKVMDVWNEVSPYLPEGTTMASGYRTKNEQREQLYGKYFSFKKKISDKFGEKEWKKYCDLYKDTTVSESERNKNDLSMHSQICEAVSAREVALPGTSKHEKGNAIDTQSSVLEERCKSLLWYSIEFEELNHAKNITAESNNCVHFEFL
jgi:hypothetical protein